MSALAPQGGPPPGVPPQIQVGGAPAGGDPEQGQGGEDKVAATLMIAMKALKAAAESESDHTYAAKIQKCVSDIQQLLATFQQGHEAALGTTAAHKAMARSSY